MGAAAKLHALRLIEGVAEHFLAARADESVAGVRVQHEDEVGKIVDQAACEFLLLMKAVFHLAAPGAVHNRAVVPDHFAADAPNAAHGGNAQPGSAVLATRGDCASR